MNAIFLYAAKHLNDRRCDYNNDRFHSSDQPINNHRKPRLQMDVSKNYTGKQFRLLESEETL